MVQRDSLLSIELLLEIRHLNRRLAKFSQLLRSQKVHVGHATLDLWLAICNYTAVFAVTLSL